MNNRLNPFILLFLLLLALMYIALKYVLFDLLEDWFL
jgi:hypothetical protein